MAAISSRPSTAAATTSGPSSIASTSTPSSADPSSTESAVVAGSVAALPSSTESAVVAGSVAALPALTGSEENGEVSGAVSGMVWTADTAVADGVVQATRMAAEGVSRSKIVTYLRRTYGRHANLVLSSWDSLRKQQTSDAANSMRLQATMQRKIAAANRKDLLNMTNGMYLQTPEVVLFFSGSWLSQWFPSPFTCPDTKREFVNCEQYMMAEKARLFGDSKTEARIMKVAEPRQHKALGRLVRDFREATWQAHREAIVNRGTMLKFTQNPELQNLLLATGDRRIAEANPRDRIWGIGLDISNPDSLKPNRWRGLNLLGAALERARATIRTNTQPPPTTIATNPLNNAPTATAATTATASAAAAAPPADTAAAVAEVAPSLADTAGDRTERRDGGNSG
jgi:ribA/ribD-fused uncharacterized protein